MVKPEPVRLPMPRQKPHESRQDLETPNEVIEAIEARFGPLTLDLAATAETAKAPFYFGPEQDSLAQDWHKYEGWLWLNPPYGREIGIWANKCAVEQLLGATILFLVPASVGSVWYVEKVRSFSHQIFLRPRIKFVGEAQGYPKDHMLCVYAYGLTGDSTWQWR